LSLAPLSWCRRCCPKSSVWLWNVEARKRLCGPRHAHRPVFTRRTSASRRHDRALGFRLTVVDGNPSPQPGSCRWLLEISAVSSWSDPKISEPFKFMGNKFGRYPNSDISCRVVARRIHLSGSQDVELLTGNRCFHSPTVLPHHEKVRNAPSLRRTGICRPWPTCHPLELWAPWHPLQPTRRMRAALQLCGPARRRYAILPSHSALLLGLGVIRLLVPRSGPF
jgi:hypothetical protein